MLTDNMLGFLGVPNPKTEVEMPKKAAKISCSDEQRFELKRLASSRTLESRLVDRAKIIFTEP